ncbi:hypothetical protein BDR07DRAFT_1427330, partial [Suillus spraguei]
MLRFCAFIVLYCALSTMTTSTSFRGAVGLQNGSRSIDKKNFWRYAGFIATPEIVIFVSMCLQFGA